MPRTLADIRNFLQKPTKENANPNVEKMAEKVKPTSEKISFKQGDIVWVNLGISYSWWPGEFNEVNKNKDKKKSDLDVKINVCDNPFSKYGETSQKANENKLSKVSKTK